MHCSSKSCVITGWCWPNDQSGTQVLTEASPPPPPRTASTIRRSIALVVTSPVNCCLIFVRMCRQACVEYKQNHQKVAVVIDHVCVTDSSRCFVLLRHRHHELAGFVQRPFSRSQLPH